MKPFKLSKEDVTILVVMLKTLFPEFIRIEVIQKEVPYVLFSKVEKQETSFFEKVFKSKNGEKKLIDLVTERISVIELFLREIPRRLSIYQIGNETHAPFFWATAAVLIADNPGLLVSHFKERFDRMGKSALENEPYAATLAKIGLLESSMKNGEYKLLEAVLKHANIDTTKGNNILAVITADQE